MSTRLVWNKGAIAAVTITSLACGGFVYAIGMGMSEPAPHSTPVASGEKVELSEPTAEPPPEPTITELPVPVIESVPVVVEPAPITDVSIQSVPEPIAVEAEALPTLNLPPCEQEDSENCYWDAARMGNGLGRSFVNIDGTYYYEESE